MTKPTAAANRLIGAIVFEWHPSNFVQQATPIIRKHIAAQQQRIEPKNLD